MHAQALLENLKKEISSQEYAALQSGSNLIISDFNRTTLLEMMNTKAAPPADIAEKDVDRLRGILEAFLSKCLPEKASAWKWIILSCTYLSFIAHRPLHPMEQLGIRISKDSAGSPIYLCPSKSYERSTACDYCICRRMSNYDKMKYQMESEFLKYDQNQLIQKLSLDFDKSYLYLTLLGRPYRINRENGSVSWSDDGFQHTGEANYNEVMTIYDLLCYSDAAAHPSGEYVSVHSLAAIHNAASPESGNLFGQKAREFDHKNTALLQACVHLNGVKAGRGDVAYCIPLFQSLSCLLQFWNSDEEFPPTLQVFADKNILQYMHYETVWFAMSHLLERLSSLMNNEN